MSRSNEISAYLFQQGETQVADLARVLGASLATIRRDLSQLEGLGLIERVHGGARLASAARAEIGHKAREDRNLSAKRAVARIAYALLCPGQTVLLDAGTTVLQLARQIRLAPLPLTVVTNGLAVAHELADLPQIQLCILGGRLRPGHMSVVGPLAEAMLQGLWLDHAFLGASALPNDLHLTSFDADEARLNAVMADRAAHLTVLADHSKLGQRATYRVRAMTSADRLITDQSPPSAFTESAAAMGLTVLIPQEVS
jgi:DeoR/GlpR family transcriptional regulator of sugar metabolism